MRLLYKLIGIVVLCLFLSCTSVVPYTVGEITTTGTMNRINYKEYDYWIFETKIQKEKQFIELLGEESELQKIQIEGKEVTLRLLPKPDRKPEIKMANSSAVLLEIVQPK